ncbi:MAG: hypothetical protein HF312_15560 [Ignavibacteria bacterium]|jgi:hypothetical protein|nr:hypothetical protein [Ignavibacteria bacterium]
MSNQKIIEQLRDGVYDGLLWRISIIGIFSVLAWNNLSHWFLVVSFFFAIKCIAWAEQNLEDIDDLETVLCK